MYISSGYRHANPMQMQSGFAAQAFQPMQQMMQMMQLMQMVQMMNMMFASGGMGAVGAMPVAPMYGPPMGGSPLGGFLGPQMGGQGLTNQTSPYGGGGMPMNAPAGGAAPASLNGVQVDRGAASTLMNSIRNNPVPPRCRPGYCYRGVKHHLRQIGVNLTGGSAYQAADQLARSGRFREVQVPRSQLRSLPAGAVVVWNRGNGRRHGHISIAMGDGREASDRVRRQITNYPNSFRVFVPRQG